MNVKLSIISVCISLSQCNINPNASVAQRKLVSGRFSELIGAGKLCAGPDRGEIPDLDDSIMADGEQLLHVLVHVHGHDAVLCVVERRQRRTTSGKSYCLLCWRFKCPSTYFTAFSDRWHGSQTRTSNSKPMIGMLMRFTEQVSQIAFPQLRQWCCRMPKRRIY